MGSSIPGSSSCTSRCYVPRPNTGCLLSLPGTCVYYTGTPLSGPGIVRNDTFNEIVESLTEYIDASGEGTVTSVGLSVPSAFSVAGSPVTTVGTLAVTAIGTTDEYIRGDGSLADFTVIESGLWTPNVTLIQGLASVTAVPCVYQRINDVVHVTGRFVCDVNATGEKMLQFSLPVATDFSTGEDMTGSISTYSVSAFGYVACDVNANEGFLLFSNNVSTDLIVYFSAQYLVI